MATTTKRQVLWCLIVSILFLKGGGSTLPKPNDDDSPILIDTTTAASIADDAFINVYLTGSSTGSTRDAAVTRREEYTNDSEGSSSGSGSSASELLDRHFQAVFGRRGGSKQHQQQQQQQQQHQHQQQHQWGTQQQQQQRRRRRVEDYNAEYYTDDDSNSAAANEKCSEFLVSFLEGSTDAHDTCSGLMNAFTAADCSYETQYNSPNDDVDDYFEEFAVHECCQALMSHHLEYCEVDRILDNLHLLLAAGILLVCECAKALVLRLNIHFLPEAAVCILVGTIFGFLAHLLPWTNIDDASFDDELFLTVLLPPIIFDAALSVSKFELKRRRGAILMFSVFGTIISTFSTGLLVHYMSKASRATTFPMLDSLTFGALISSIDPVAILSVLTSLNLDQKDTIFILVFGESLLNDGIAITLFQTLGGRFDGKTNDGTTNPEEIFDALATFLISMFGSIAIGVVCGCLAWVFFYFLDRSLSPVMEVGCFFLWALIPYYIADAINLSGIVTIVAVGFFMDIYIAGPKGGPKKDDHDHPLSPEAATTPEYLDISALHLSAKSFDNSVAPFPSTERLHLSAIADRHVRFVAHLTSQLAENAIFVYLGLFLFSSNYDWDPTLITIAIVSCVLSRSLMIVIVSFLVNQIYKCRGRDGDSGSNSSKTARAIQDPRTQAVLVLAGLRGAVSLALAEDVPIYNQGTGEGCEFKQVMKGMTSGCIIFTTFVFGGGAYYILPHLGITPDPSPLHKQTNLPTVV